MKFSFTGVLFLSVCFAISAQNKKWTLEECVNYAYENNISIKQGENNLLSDEQDVKASKGNLLPSLSANTSQSLSLGSVELFPGSFANRTFHSTSVGLNVSQNVFSGYRNKMLYQQSQLNLEKNQLSQDKLIDDIGLFVVNTYLDILFNKENLETARAQYEFSEKQLDQVKKLVDAGVQPQSNIYDVEATLSNDAQTVTIAENNHDLSLLRLSQLLQVPFDENFDVEVIDVGIPSEAIMYDNISDILNYAMANRSEIKVAEMNMEVDSLNVEIAQSGYRPTVSFNYGYNTGANFSNLSSDNSFFQQLNDNRGHVFGLNVSVPIFSRLQNKTAVAKSTIRQENSKLNLEQAKFDLESTIQTAFTDAKAALKTYAAAQKSMESQELSFNNSQERYNIGAMSSFDLDQARIRLVNAQSSLINAKYDFVFKTKVLDFYLGKEITF